MSNSDLELAVRKRILREPFCSISHMVGAGLSIAALVVLLIISRGRPWHTVAFALYGASLIALYGASTIYHSLHVSEKNKFRLAKLDHVAIFLLIAGTYTPVCLLTLRGAWGWSILGVEIGLAAIGITATIVAKRPTDVLRIIIYILMGWLAVIAVSPLRDKLPAAGMAWLFAGGITYTVGTVIFAVDKPHLIPGKFTAHDLWHLFVLGGSACHFVLMACFVAPIG